MPLDDSVEDGGLVSVAVDMRVLLRVTKTARSLARMSGGYKVGAIKPFLPSFAGEVSAS